MRLHINKLTRLCFVFCLLMGAISLSNAAMQGRPLPKDGVLGVFSFAKIPTVVIDDNAVKLSAGAQIRNQKNLIVQVEALTSMKKNADIHVLYEKNKFGQIQRMWMLTDEEYERIKSGDKPNPLPAIKPH